MTRSFIIRTGPRCQWTKQEDESTTSTTVQVIILGTNISLSSSSSSSKPTMVTEDAVGTTTELTTIGTTLLEVAISSTTVDGKDKTTLDSITTTRQPEETTTHETLLPSTTVTTQTAIGAVPTLTTPSTPLIDDAINKELDCCGTTTADKTLPSTLLMHQTTPATIFVLTDSTSTPTISTSTATAATIESLPVTMIPSEELPIVTEDEPLDLLTDPSPTDEPDWYTDYVTEPITTSTVLPITTPTTTITDAPTTTVAAATPTTLSSNANCPLDLCLNGGTCVATVDGWQCRCWWRYEGRRCQLANKVKVPQFHGNSYLTYAVPERTARQEILQVRIEFSTTSPIGLITYIHRYTCVFLQF